MIYDCIIKSVDEEEITIDIDGNELVCFCNVGTDHLAGDRIKCALSLYDDYSICENIEKECKIVRKGNSYSYEIYGALDADKRIMRSVIDFELEEEDIYDIAYLDKEMFGLLVQRIDIEII